MKCEDLNIAFSLGGLGFRPLAKSDLPMTLAWRNQERVRSQLFTTRELTLAEHEAWFAAQVSSNTDQTWIFEDQQGPVGQAALYGISWETGTAEFGRLMVGEERALGRRYGTVATLGLCDVAFRKLKLQLVRLVVRSDNAAALRAYERAGFASAATLPGGKQGMLACPGPEREWEKWDDDGVVEQILSYWQEPLEREHRQWLAQQILLLGCAGDASKLTHVLEFGCGSGELYAALCQAGMSPTEYRGYDVSRRMLGWASARGSEFRYGDALALPASNLSGTRQKGHVVLCCEVLGHLPTASPMLEALLKQTADGGHLFVSAWLADQDQLQTERQGNSTFLHHIYSRNQLLLQIRALDPLARIDTVSGALTTLLHIQPRALPVVTEVVDRPRHTVILGSYNRPKFVREAIASVFSQTQDSWQLIITDDGSNAETICAIRSAIGADPRCEFIGHTNLQDGPRPDAQYRAIARINAALPLVRGELVHYLPDDDFYPPERFAIFDQAFSDPSVFLVYGRLSRVRTDGGKPKPDIFPGGPVMKPICQLDHTQVVHRASCLEVVPQWPTQGIYYDSDGVFFHELIQAGFGPIRPVDQLVSYHRDHSHNMIVLKEATTSERE